MFPFPDTKAIPMSGDWKYAVSKNSKHPKEAKAFLKWLWEDGKYANALSLCSPIKGGKSNDPAITELLSYNLPSVTMDIDSPLTIQMFKDSRIDLAVALQDYMTSKNTQGVIKSYNAKWNKAKNSIVLAAVKD